MSVQTGLDGGLRRYGEFDAVTGAPILNALDAAAGPPRHDAGRPLGDAPSAAAQPGDDPARQPAAASAAGDGAVRPQGDDPVGQHDGDGGADRSGCGRATSRSRQYATALARVAVDWLGGDARQPARPLLIAHIDLTQATASAAGTVELNVGGPLPRLTARLADSLAADADICAVLFDGARPLAVSAKLTAPTIPVRTRIAVGAHDRGCRFPGSADPAGHTDIHHLRERHRGGDHHPDNLVQLSRRHHTLTHQHSWTLTLEPDSGQVTATRKHRAWRSLPRGTPLAPPGRGDPHRPR